MLLACLTINFLYWFSFPVTLILCFRGINIPRIRVNWVFNCFTSLYVWKFIWFNKVAFHKFFRKLSWKLFLFHRWNLFYVLLFQSLNQLFPIFLLQNCILQLLFLKVLHFSFLFFINYLEAYLCYFPDSRINLIVF